MKFTQIVEFQTSRIQDLNAYFDAWIARTEGQRVPHQAMLYRDRDSENTYQLVVEFSSYATGMENSRRPQTGEFATYLASICDQPPRFRNLDAMRDEHL
jgi:quinol monooxygenase YgiN